MPCYNYGKYVSEAIQSILKQSFADFEFIIVDDGSKDNSSHEIKAHVDDRIIFVPLKENKGNYYARNIGMRLAKGKYVCVMDADDISYPQRLAVQYNYLEKHPKMGAIGSWAEYIDENGLLTGRPMNSLTEPWEKLKVFLLMNNYFIHPTIMFRSYLLHKHHLFYNEKYKFASDFDFISRFSLVSPVCNMGEVLVKYRIHSAQITTEKNILQNQYADQIRLAQLKKFNIKLTKQEKNAYLFLMKGNLLENKQELEFGMNVLNKVLSRNHKLKLYNQQLLYDFFDYIVSLAHEKMQT